MGFGEWDRGIKGRHVGGGQPILMRDNIEAELFCAILLKSGKDWIEFRDYTELYASDEASTNSKTARQWRQAQEMDFKNPHVELVAWFHSIWFGECCIYFGYDPAVVRERLDVPDPYPASDTYLEHVDDMAYATDVGGNVLGEMGLI